MKIWDGTAGTPCTSFQCFSPIVYIVFLSENIGC